MNDGTVVWKPIEGRPTRTVLEDLPTVLLALRGPMGPVDAAAIGTAAGDVLVLTLPRLETVAKFQLQSGSVRAITLVAEGAFHFLVGTQHGAVWSLSDRRTERCEHVFSIDGPVSSLHLEGDSSTSEAVGSTMSGRGTARPTTFETRRRPTLFASNAA